MLGTYILSLCDATFATKLSVFRVVGGEATCIEGNTNTMDPTHAGTHPHAPILYTAHVSYSGMVLVL